MAEFFNVTPQIPLKLMILVTMNHNMLLTIETIFFQKNINYIYILRK
jgi:hypothetical protein